MGSAVLVAIFFANITICFENLFRRLLKHAKGKYNILFISLSHPSPAYGTCPALRWGPMVFVFC
jgi:hypothetical protein